MLDAGAVDVAGVKELGEADVGTIVGAADRGDDMGWLPRRTMTRIPDLSNTSIVVLIRLIAELPAGPAVALAN
jgi:hypothetical protein